MSARKGRKSKPWPTKRMPRCPVSAQTHGDPRYWTESEWRLFREWARKLKDYPDQNNTKAA